MKRYLGYEYNKAGKLEEAYAYTIAPEDLEIIENIILYYDYHTVAGLNKRRPEFVEDDFNKLLRILNNITETI